MLFWIDVIFLLHHAAAHHSQLASQLGRLLRLEHTNITTRSPATFNLLNRLRIDSSGRLSRLLSVKISHVLVALVTNRVV